MRKNGFKKDLPALLPRVYIINKYIIRFFSCNLELICSCEIFKKLKLHEPLRRMQFQLFEKLTRAN